MDQPEGEARKRVPGQSERAWHPRLRRVIERVFTGTPERVIAVGRVAFASLALLAIYADLAQPARGGAAAYVVLLGYLGVSAIVASAPARMLANRRLQLAPHAVDIVVFSLLMYFTDGPTSPFFVFFTFVLVTATLRWDWRGALATSAVLVGLLLLVSYVDFAVLHGGDAYLIADAGVPATDVAGVPETDLGTPLTTGSLSAGPASDQAALVIRAGYLLIVGAMLAFVGAFREREAVQRARMRLARDMHDTVLQNLTAANLLLGAAARSLPEKAQATLREVGNLLVEQQRRIRSIVEFANPKPGRVVARAFADEIGALAAAIGRQWRCTVSVAVHPPDLDVPEAIATELCMILSEAVANAVQHGGADRIDAVVEGRGATIHVQLVDNGGRRGARPGSGSDDGEVHPFFLEQRVTELGGRLTATRTATGVVLSIDVPRS